MNATASRAGSAAAYRNRHDRWCGASSSPQASAPAPAPTAFSMASMPKPRPRAQAGSSSASIVQVRATSSPRNPRANSWQIPNATIPGASAVAMVAAV